MEYGYMENGVLKSMFLEPISGKSGAKSVEQQASELSDTWKPVDVIDVLQLNAPEDNYVIIPVPYDAGDRISYRYEKRFDRRKVRADIQALKDGLSNSDYKIMKCYEASLMSEAAPYDVNELHIERQANRDRINDLELLLKNNQ
jgi:hypothetical protein